MSGPWLDESGHKFNLAGYILGYKRVGSDVRTDSEKTRYGSSFGSNGLGTSTGLKEPIEPNSMMVDPT